MAENKSVKAAKKAEEASEESTPQEHQRAEKKKSRWTQATCHKAAKRYASRDEWMHGAPSSFKAAVAKGWDAECCAHMTAKSVAPKAAKAVKAPAKSAKAPAAKKSRTA